MVFRRRVQISASLSVTRYTQQQQFITERFQTINTHRFGSVVRDKNYVYPVYVRWCDVLMPPLSVDIRGFGEFSEILDKTLSCIFKINRPMLSYRQCLAQTALQRNGEHHPTPMWRFRNFVAILTYFRLQDWLQAVKTWKRVRSPTYCWKCSIAWRTRLWPPGTRHMAPSISSAATLDAEWFELRLCAITLMPDVCASTWDRPSWSHSQTVNDHYHKQILKNNTPQI